MSPSVVAKTMFWLGTSNVAAAAATSAADAAWSSRKIASAVRPGVSAVHCIATPYPDTPAGGAPSTDGPSAASRAAVITSETIGPCWVERTTIVSDSPPLTVITS